MTANGQTEFQAFRWIWWAACVWWSMTIISRTEMELKLHISMLSSFTEYIVVKAVENIFNTLHAVVKRLILPLKTNKQGRSQRGCQGVFFQI